MTCEQQGDYMTDEERFKEIKRAMVDKPEISFAHIGRIVGKTRQYIFKQSKVGKGPDYELILKELGLLTDGRK